MRKWRVMAAAAALFGFHAPAEAQQVFLGNPNVPLTGTSTLAICPSTGTNLTIADCNPIVQPYVTRASLGQYFDVAALFSGSVLQGDGFLTEQGVTHLSYSVRYSGADANGYATFEAFNIVGSGADSTGLGVNAPCAGCGWFTFNVTGGPALLRSQTPIDAPVPEPATWAMMLLGFAAIGLTSRRAERRRSMAA